MSFLKKILKRIEKSSKSVGFNLKKHVNKKLAWMEEEDLGAGLTPLQQFDTPAKVTPPAAPIDPSINIAMEKYINQNANAEQLAPMPPEWISDIGLRMNFQNLAQNILGNMSEAFVSRALQATEVMQEEPPQEAQPAQEETWQSLGDFDIDLVETFFSSPNIQQTIQSISNSIMKSGYRQGIDADTAEEIVLESAKIALGQPGVKQRGGGSRRDQRFNYFLFNPQKMPPNVAQALNAQGQPSNTDESIAFLKENFGEELIQALYEQVANEDPSIKQWVLKSSGNVGSVIEKSLGTSLTGGEDRGTNIQDSDIGEMHKNRVQQRETDIRLIDSQKDQITKAALSFSRLYIQDIIYGMKDILSGAVESAYAQYPENADKIERMQVFNKQLLDQYLKLSMVMPEIDAKGNAVFKNNEGQFTIPQEELVNLFKGQIDRPAAEIANEIIEDRKREEVGFDIGKWFKEGIAGKKGRSVLEHRSLQNSYKNAFDIKTAILEAYKSGKVDIKSIASNPGQFFTGTEGQVVRDAQGKIVRDEQGQPERVGGMDSKDMVYALNKLSNADGEMSEGDRAVRRERFVKRTVTEAADLANPKNNFNLYKKFIDKDFKGKTSDESKAVNSMRPNAQWDVRYLMNGLNAEKNNKEKNKFSDVFQAFFGALNPHKKVRQEFPDIYKNIMGKNDEEFQEDTSMLNSVDRNEFLQLEKLRNHFQESLDIKNKTIESEENKAKKLAARHHAKIGKEYEKHLSMLKSQGMPPISLGDFVGVPDWNGEDILSKDQYAGIVQNRGLNIGKIIETLWRVPGKDYKQKKLVPPMTKIEEMGGTDINLYRDKAGKLKEKPRREWLDPQNPEYVAANIRQQGIPFIQNKLQEVETQLAEFKNIHKMSESKYRILSALCKNYHLKMASIERLQNSYQGNKFASVVVDLDVLTCEIEKKFGEDFDSIFRM